MKRNVFIRNSAISTIGASFLGMHDLLGCAPVSIIKNNPRILQLDLLTGIPVEELKKFYTATLELPLLSSQKDRFTFQAGETVITFVQADEKAATPFYHFAFNIPQNKIVKARNWQLKRTALSATPSQLIDKSYPDDIRHFSHWNAHSVFFWDPAGNLVEYIARHDLNNSTEGDFSSKDVLCTSEIAFIVTDTETIAEEIKSACSLAQYRGGDENFRAIGDENGLLLVIKKGRVWEAHTNISKTPDTIKTTVTIRGNKEKKWSPENYPFKIIVKN